MLSSIHPLGEAGRRQRWHLTVAAHLVGATLGGALVGGLVGVPGAVIAAAGVPLPVRLVVAGVVAAGAAFVDARGWPGWLWTPHRQVNEDWLTRYRGWVYGGGFGFQLGAGVTTIITAATLYVVGALALAVGSLPWATLLGAGFGAARGATVLWGRGITNSEQLLAFHQRLQARAGLGRRLAVGADVTVALAAAAAVVWSVGGTG